MKFIDAAQYSALPPCVATIGFFDGVHRGHKFLIEQLCRLADETSMASLIITFDNHPSEVLDNKVHPYQLTTLEEKKQLLADTEADYCVLLHFDKDMLHLSAQTFMEQIMYRQLHVRALLNGYDHLFGYGCKEHFDDYVRYGKAIGMEVKEAQPLRLDDEIISSSRIRTKLQLGDVDAAAHLLGHPYSVSGTVETGRQVGRTLGFPTANISIDNSYKLLPERGVYVVNVVMEGNVYGGMLNIGTRPTLHDGRPLTVEAHLFDFKGNLYGKPLSVLFRARLRDERRFADDKELAHQLTIDAATAENYLRTLGPVER
jgi:riboflavin kinase/FMN adenylyltransferase